MRNGRGHPDAHGSAGDQLCGPQLLWQPSFGEAAVMSGRGPKAVIHR